MKVTIIQQPHLRLIVAKSEKFPEGNRQAFGSIESHLGTLKGRRFYGLVFPSGGGEGLDYFAGLIPRDENEEEKFIALGFAIREVAGGPCARVKLLDWASKTEQIGPTFGKLIEDYGIDPSRPQMEFYRSLTELHLLLPVPS